MVARKLDYSGRLGEVHVPTLVCAEHTDPQAPVTCARELAAGIPGARLAVLSFQNCVNGSNEKHV